MNDKSISRLLLLLLAMFLTGCGNARNNPAVDPRKNDSSNPILFLVAASTKDAVEELSADFESKTGALVRISPGPSNTLATQITSGAPADLFLSANERWATAIKDTGMSAEAISFLTNDLVIVVPKGNPAEVRNPRNLASARVTRLALAGENVPVGLYAEQALKSHELYQQLLDAKKIVRGQDVRATLNYVERGEAEAGIVYSTDARISDDVEIVYQFDPSTHEKIVYPLVLIKRDTPNSAARELYDFLRSPEAATVFEKHGFKQLQSD